MRKLQYLEAALRNLTITSRTRAGVSDTSSAFEKPKLVSEGSALASRAESNFRDALNWLMDQPVPSSVRPEQVKVLLEETATRVSDGLLKQGQGLFRTWKTKFAHQTQPELIQKDLDQFYIFLAAALAWRLREPVNTAAWVEKELDSTIHPFADGCGRTAKAVSAWVLFQADLPLPVYPNREEYYGNIERPLNEWSRWYGGLIPQQPT